MAIPVKKKIKHYRGDDFRYGFILHQYVDPDDTSLGTEPRDLTGWTVEVESDPDLTITVTPDPLDDTGEVVCEIDAADLGDEQESIVKFDIQLTDLGGFSRTYVQVQITLQEQVA